MDDRSTLERAFDHIAAAPVAAAPAVAPVAPDAELVEAIRRTKAMLGQLLAEEAAQTPWARWKSTTCDLVNWWAARLMRALYIAPFRICRRNVLSAPCQIETAPSGANPATACPTCRAL